MALKTNFSFEVQYLATSSLTQPQRDEVMDSLGPRLQQLLGAQDADATVAVSEGHQGSNHKIVELTTGLPDAQLTQILQAFSAQHGVSVSALE